MDTLALLVKKIFLCLNILFFFQFFFHFFFLKDLYDGKAVFEEGNVCDGPLLVIYDDGECIKAETKEEKGHFILAAGKPLGEPIVRRRGFVMASQEDLEQAHSDYKEGKLLTRVNN